MTGNTVQLIGICLLVIFILITVIYIVTFKKRRDKLLDIIQKEY